MNVCTSLVQVAHAAGYVADHVNYLSLGGLKDWQLLPVIHEREFTFVTNNGADFLALFGKEPLHPGIIIIVPNVTPILLRELSRPPLTTSVHGIRPIVWLRSNT